MEKKNIDNQIKKSIVDSKENRTKLYLEAWKRLIKKDKQFYDLISVNDIENLVNYRDEDISNRIEIKALKKERQKMLKEEKEQLAKGLAEEIGIGMGKSIEYSNVVMKAVLLGLFGGPVGISVIACKELISAKQTQEELKKSIIESIENGSEVDVHNLIAKKDREYGKLLNFSGFLDYIKKSDVFHELLLNEEEKKKIIESLKKAGRESFEMFKELEDVKDEKLLKKEQEKFEEDEEDPEPEIGVKTIY